MIPKRINTVLLSIIRKIAKKYRLPILKVTWKLPTSIRSGTICRCGHCGFEGHCYGTPTSSIGVSAPWCPQCGLNNQLTPIKKATQHIVELDGYGATYPQ
jgi:hypothetical protein